MKGTILFLIVALFAGCTPKQNSNSNEKLTIFVSISPQAGLINNLTADHENVVIRTLVGEGQSPHSYEPTARQLTHLSEADVLFTIGVPFEQALLGKIKSLYPNLRIVATDEGLEKRTMPHVHHGEHCSHEHGEKDPHVWLSPQNAQLISERMTDVLMEIDPEHQALFMKNAHSLSERLTKHHTQIQSTLAPFKGSRFYVFHPSFGYFADAYGLEQIPIELEGKSPSPRQLAQLIEQARLDDVKIIFVQKQFPSGSADAVAQAIGGRVVQLDPLAEDIVANIKKITESVVQALKQ